MREFFQQIQNIFLNLFKAPALIEILRQPNMKLAAFVALNLVVFTETGLLVGFFLPGDSLLVVAGLVASIADWPVALLIVTLCIAAIVGDSVGYAIGRRAGPAIYDRKETRLFRKSHLLAAQAFYEKHGGKTIVLARFMPFVRTFAPVVAGVANMPYARFVLFNIVGGIAWVTSMILIGYYLETAIDPPLQRVFGPEFTVRDYIEWVIVVVVLASIAPMVFAWFRSRRPGRRSSEPMKLVA